jgi:hypothetical protein
MFRNYKAQRLGILEGEIRTIKDRLRNLEYKCRVLSEHRERTEGCSNGASFCEYGERQPGVLDRLDALEKYLSLTLTREDAQPARWEPQDSKKSN